MTVKGVATIALLTIIALMGSSNANARTRYKRMDPNCIATGKVINRLLDIIEALEDRVTKLKAHKPAWAAKIRKWIDCQKAQIFLAKRKWLKGEIAKLKKQLAQLKSSKMDPDARRAAIRALKRKIAKYQKELAALKAKIALLPLCPSARPIVDAAAVQKLSEALTGLAAAVDRLIKSGFRAPALEKRLDKLLIAHKLTQLLIAHKLTQNYLLDVTAELSALRRDLKKGIVVRKASPFPGGRVLNWAGWHFTGGLEVGYTLFSGSPEYAVPIMGNVCVEYIHHSHLGLEACLKAGALLTEVRDVIGGWHRVAPFIFGGSLAGAVRWDIFGITIPKIEVAYSQNPLKGEKGLLWVNIYGGIQLTIVEHLVLGMDLGTSGQSDAPFLGGFHMRWSIRGRY